MRVLVACEFSGRVRDAFIAKGHDAISCDKLKSEKPGPHYLGDVRDILHSKEWDLIIAHPPCTYLALSGVQWLKGDKERWRKMLKAVEFFNLFLDHPCSRVCVENPIIHGYAKRRLSVSDYTQKTQPYFHGHPEKKSTCLWLKGLPVLKASSNVSHLMLGQHGGDNNRVHTEPDSKSRQKNRSRTFEGIAKAMADQWG
jgi:hypothetical protein